MYNASGLHAMITEANDNLISRTEGNVMNLRL